MLWPISTSTGRHTPRAQAPRFGIVEPIISEEKKYRSGKNGYTFMLYNQKRVPGNLCFPCGVLGQKPQSRRVFVVCVAALLSSAKRVVQQ